MMRQDKGASPSGDRAAAANAVEPLSGVSSTAGIPLREERGCDVCGRSPIVGVASSGMGPISFGYCRECGHKPAEPEFMFAMTFEDCGDQVAEWVKNIWTWKDGAYIQWPDWIALGAENG